MSTNINGLEYCRSHNTHLVPICSIALVLISINNKHPVAFLHRGATHFVIPGHRLLASHTILTHTLAKTRPQEGKGCLNSALTVVASHAETTVNALRTRQSRSSLLSPPACSSPTWIISKFDVMSRPIVTA